MEAEALRLFKTLYDLSADNQVDSMKGMLLKELLEISQSPYSSRGSGKSAMVHLLYHLLKASKDYFVFSVKGSTTRRRKSEDTITATKSFEHFEQRIYKFKDDLEKSIIITSAIQIPTRENKIMELLYNKAKNFDTYAIYKFISEAGPSGITYAQISQKYNQEYGPLRHLSSIKIANYCKKMLEKNGFIQCLQASSDPNNLVKGTERVVVLTKYAYKAEQRELFRLDPPAPPLPKSKRTLSPAPTEEQKKPKTKEKVTEHKKELDQIKEETRGMTMRQIIGQSIRSELAQKSGGLTIGEIAYILDMEKAKKAVNRVVEDMAKGNPLIYGATEGSGKVRFNKYVLAENGRVKKEEVKMQDEGLTGYYGKFDHLVAMVTEKGEKSNPVIEGLNLLQKLNENSVKIMEEILEKKITGFRKKYKKHFSNSHFKKLVVKTVLVGIIEESDHGQKQKKRREIATETLNRYIFCLNKVEEHKVLSMLELMNMITQGLEKEQGITIARKTLKKIMQNLTKSGLIKTSAFTIDLCPSESEVATASFTRYIFYAPDVSPDDERITAKSQVDNKTIKTEPEPQPEKEPEEDNKVDMSAYRVSLTERRSDMLKKIMEKHLKLKVRPYFYRYRDYVERAVMKKKLTEMFVPSKVFFEESALASLNIWKSQALSDITPLTGEGNEVARKEDFEKFHKQIKEIDKKIKVKERPSKLKFEDKFKVAAEPVLGLNRRTPELSLTTLLKKCKNTRQGPELVELLCANGVIDIKRQPITHPGEVFGKGLVQVTGAQEVELGELNITDMEYLTEMRKEEMIITPYGK
eukprot:TRINITY_DN88840_c0_g1_i1.p1 TRINITY_DN88840_c0_g1~~TRINITY_DN88840_c0_g1_i1.p1  ORF type:complete len:834 (-),score=133.08 TRINITY_DN88840_c0_g1_i1:132-2552(-)